MFDTVVQGKGMARAMMPGGAWTVSAKELLTEVPRFGKPDNLPDALEQAKSRTAVAR